MDKSKTHKSPAWFWTARIVGLVYIAVMVFWFGAEIFFPHAEGTVTAVEFIPMIFMPIGLLAGLIIAWAWEFAGGLTVIISALAFYISIFAIRAGEIDQSILVVVLILAIPGILYLISYFRNCSKDDRS
ncbi:hypothetical protein ACFL1U_00605 [Patescibacteria group bacterium]